MYWTKTTANYLTGQLFSHDNIHIHKNIPHMELIAWNWSASYGYNMMINDLDASEGWQNKTHNANIDVMLAFQLPIHVPGNKK